MWTEYFWCAINRTRVQILLRHPKLFMGYSYFACWKPPRWDGCDLLPQLPSTRRLIWTCKWKPQASHPPILTGFTQSCAKTFSRCKEPFIFHPSLNSCASHCQSQVCLTCQFNMPVSLHIAGYKSLILTVKTGKGVATIHRLLGYSRSSYQSNTGYSRGCLQTHQSFKHWVQ